MKFKLLSTLLVSGALLIAGQALAQSMIQQSSGLNAVPAPTKAKTHKKAKAAAPTATAKGSQAQLVPNVLPAKNTDASAGPAPATK